MALKRGIWTTVEPETNPGNSTAPNSSKMLLGTHFYASKLIVDLLHLLRDIANPLVKYTVVTEFCRCGLQVSNNL